MGFDRRRVPLLVVLWAGQLLLTSASFGTASPRIVTSPLGEKRFRFDTSEDHVVLYHEKGSHLVFVGTAGKLYRHNYENSTTNMVPFGIEGSSSQCKKHEDAKNYLTLLEKYEGKLLVCGTNACNPTCWNLVGDKKEPGISAQGLAPFGLDPNALVLIDGKEIYSTIKKHQYNGRIPRIRRIRGSAELYTSDTVMNKPQFVKAAVLKQDKDYNNKLYYFFREENPDWPRNAAAPMSVSRVAQLCKGDKGGTGSLSGAKWTTFLKSTLLCVDSATDRHFNRLQDVYIVESSDWQETRVYGLFLNEWEYSAVCVYSVGAINTVFRTSPFKGFNGQLPTVRPGQCQNGELTPHETFKVADSHPEVAHPVKQETMLFHSKHRYQHIGVHQVQVADEATYNVLYLATDEGTIHKVAALPTGAMNVLEIQPFQSSAKIRSMILDNERNELFVASSSEVVQLPLAMCEAYQNNCESCVLARDPNCGWINGKCTSVYEHRNGTLLQALTHDIPWDICASSNQSSTKGDGTKHYEDVVPSSRYYLNCSIISHHANYFWLHGNQSVKHCSSGHRHCIHLIDRMNEENYGTYTCISQEGWFNQTLMTECLGNPLQTTMDSRSGLPKGWATKASLSFWLGLLHMIAVIFLIQ